MDCLGIFEGHISYTICWFMSFMYIASGTKEIYAVINIDSFCQDSVDIKKIQFQ